MTKQEVIEELEYLKRLLEEGSKDSYNNGFINALKYTLNVVKQLDEPEKLDKPERPVITEDEAKWINDLKSIYDLPDVLYHTTRCGYDDNGFTFTYLGNVYKLPIEDNIDCIELDIIRERLVNAVIYDYEVKEEQLYTVKFSSKDLNNLYIGVHRDTYQVSFSAIPVNDEQTKSWFTEWDLKKFNFWENPAFIVEKVK